jgi:hypothetical protein
MVASAMKRRGSSTARWNRPNAMRIRKSARRVARMAGAIRSTLIPTTVANPRSRYAEWAVTPM